MVKLDDQGNLTLVYGSGKVIWSSNSLASGLNTNLVAQLLDTGNLVIKNETEILIWQSFDHPGDTYLPGMKVGKNFITGRETYLTSWRSADDPSPGEYTFKLLAVKGKYQQVYFMRSAAILTRLGPYNGKLFSGRPNFTPDPAVNPTYHIPMVVTQNEIYFTFNYKINDTAFLLRIVTSSGKLEVSQLKFPNPRLMPITTITVDYCDNYGVCGPYGSCSIATSPFCGCLKGFERKTTISDEKSADHNNTSVCRRSIALDCAPGEGFLKFSSMKLPDTENAVFSGNMSLKDLACNNNCSCTAYANPNITQGGVGCLLWFGGLIDVRVYSQNGQDLYVRLAASELSALLTLLGFILAIYIRRKWKKSSDVGSSSHMGSVEVPLFGLSKISRATNDFSDDNKLGEGGFGPVYKGVLEEGQEIAVKRLSKSSRQGLDEFKNEVICIAKLQHRNLVKLLGYCIQKDEKMGYISPEYASNGLFSIKSDIFSFGVLVLEIVSGKKNRGFVHEDHDDSLLGHASVLKNHPFIQPYHEPMIH
ncbi:hypothetical protein R6Q59_029712 [Mikania micrantha]